jgi:hypothetical protein
MSEYARQVVAACILLSSPLRVLTLKPRPWPNAARKKSKARLPAPHCADQSAGCHERAGCTRPPVLEVRSCRQIRCSMPSCATTDTPSGPQPERCAAYWGAAQRTLHSAHTAAAAPTAAPADSDNSGPEPRRPKATPRHSPTNPDTAPRLMPEADADGRKGRLSLGRGLGCNDLLIVHCLEDGHNKLLALVEVVADLQRRHAQFTINSVTMFTINLVTMPT